MDEWLTLAGLVGVGLAFTCGIALVACCTDDHLDLRRVRCAARSAGEAMLVTLAAALPFVLMALVATSPGLLALLQVGLAFWGIGLCLTAPILVPFLNEG